MLCSGFLAVEDRDFFFFICLSVLHYLEVYYQNNPIILVNSFNIFLISRTDTYHGISD